MKKQFFFDDYQLFGRDNVTRRYGKPEKISLYNDGICSTDYATGWVFRLPDGRWRMLYFAMSPAFEGRKLFAAISDDGVSFRPEPLWENPEAEGKQFAHEVMPINGEVAFIFEDRHCSNKNETYKLLMSDLFFENLYCDDPIYVSPDLIHWTKREKGQWGEVTEPLAGVFYNEHKQVYTVVHRPFWGVRRAGYRETSDWENYTEYRECLNVDDQDEPLSEIYGMLPFAYEGMYIGLPHIYCGLHSERNAKFKNGYIEVHLAYSYDGRYWRRSAREPFITGRYPAEGEDCYPMTWVTCMCQADDGSVRFYSSASQCEHGDVAFNQSDKMTGNIFVYQLRQDGFVSFATEDAAKPSVVITREKVWHSGELHLNLRAEQATVAVYTSNENENVSGNVLGIAVPVEGYSHEDCIPFSGDSTDWIPTYQNGKTLADLSGSVLVFEVKFQNGEIFSLAGDYTDVFNTEGARYRKMGILPQR